MPSFPALQIFASSTGDTIRRFIASPSLTHALTALRLKDAESLHIYRNGPVLYFKPVSPDELLSAVKTLCDLAGKLPTSDARMNLDGLPPEFKKLSSLIREWAEPDDELKSELLERKSEAALKKFVERRCDTSC